MKIFVIHYKKLVKRKENILKQFEKYNITDFEFVEIDRDELHSTSWGGDGATICVDSYLINKKCAIKLCEYFNNLSSKINLYIDWYLNTIIRNYNFKIYWMEPTIVTQGSENGLFIKSY